MEIRDIIVPTMDTARYKFLIDLCLSSHQPLSFIGPTGTGKSAYVQEKLMRSIDPDKFTPFFINFSAQTSANQVQVMKAKETEDFITRILKYQAFLFLFILGCCDVQT